MEPKSEQSKELLALVGSNEKSHFLWDKIKRALFLYCDEIEQESLFLGSLYAQGVLRENPFNLERHAVGDKMFARCHALGALGEQKAIQELLVALERSGNQDIIAKIATHAREALGGTGSRALQSDDPSRLCPVAVKKVGNEEGPKELIWSGLGEDYQLYAIGVTEDAIFVGGRSKRSDESIIRAYDFQTKRCIHEIHADVFLMECSKEVLILQTADNLMYIYVGMTISEEFQTSEIIKMKLRGSILVTVDKSGVLKKELLNINASLIAMWEIRVPSGEEPVERVDHNEQYVVCGYGRQTRVYAATDGSLLQLVEGLMTGLYEGYVFTRNTDSQWTAWHERTGKRFTRTDNAIVQVVAGSGKTIAFGRSDGSIQVYGADDILTTRPSRMASSPEYPTGKTYKHHDNWILSLYVQNGWMVSRCMNDKIFLCKLDV